MTGHDHEQFQDDVGAYLLGALSDDERRAFELHLEICPHCREESERLRLAADALPRSVEQLDPPASLKASLMDVVEREARQAGSGTARKPARAWLGRLIPSSGGGLRPVLAVGALSVGLAVGYVTAAQITGDGSSTKTVAAQVDADRAGLARASLKYRDDGDDGATLIAEGLRALGPNRVYQAWIERDDSMQKSRYVAQPTFVAGRKGEGAVALPDSIDGAKAVLVTRERRGGADQPTEVPIMRIEL